MLLAAALVAGCGGEDEGGGGGDKGKLVIVAPGGTYGAAVVAAYLQPFEEKTGIDVQLVEGGDNPVAQVEGQVKSGNVLWDAALCNPTVVGATPDLWADLPVDEIQADNKPVVEVPIGHKMSLNDIESFPIIVSLKKSFPDGGPSTWAEFFDTKKFPGPRGLPNVGLESAFHVPAIALMADGVAPEDLLPLDLDRAYAKMDELKPDVRVIWSTFAQGVDIMRTGDVVANALIDGRAYQMRDGGMDVDISFQQGFRASAGWCVVKGAKNAENAHKLFKYILDNAQQQAIFSSLTFYGPPTEAGVTAAKELGVEETGSSHVDELIPDSEELVKYVEENSEELLGRWNRWVAK
jgi:putative spermidine/putrescine transport system substrate-binding protein